eukprot:scaffold17_cov354-Pavlova_lutheri.AAC.27
MEPRKHRALVRPRNHPDGGSFFSTTPRGGEGRRGEFLLHDPKGRRGEERGVSSPRPQGEERGGEGRRGEERGWLGVSSPRPQGEEGMDTSDNGQVTRPRVSTPQCQADVRDAEGSMEGLVSRKTGEVHDGSWRGERPSLENLQCHRLVSLNRLTKLLLGTSVRKPSVILHKLLRTYTFGLIGWKRGRNLAFRLLCISLERRRKYAIDGRGARRWGT